MDGMMTIDPKFTDYFFDVLYPQIPEGGCNPDYVDPDEEDNDDDD